MEGYKAYGPADQKKGHHGRCASQAPDGLAGIAGMLSGSCHSRSRLRLDDALLYRAAALAIGREHADGVAPASSRDRDDEMHFTWLEDHPPVVLPLFERSLEDAVAVD